MADLGNLMFRMGLNTKDFEKQMQDELALAKKAAEEIKKAFADIKLPTGGKGGVTAATGGSTTSKMNDELKVTDDLYKKLANKIQLVSEAQNKLRINAAYGFNGKYVQDAISKLENFKSLLQTGLGTGSRSYAQEAMKLFSNQDYAVLQKQVQNLIREGDKYNQSLGKQAEAQRKAQEAAERQKLTISQMNAQYQRLAEAIDKVKFAQSHVNKGGINAAGTLTTNSLAQLQAAQRQLQNTMIGVSTGKATKLDVQTSMERATRAIRESSTAIQQQRAINTEAQRQQMQGQAQILARQRAINAAQAENARLIAQSNSHFSIMRNLVGQVGSMIGMYFSVYALQGFIKDLVRIRGEFDMQYTALKAILQSEQQASELFSQLKTLAPLSPYQFKDLATYAKQLSAYSIPYNELFDTTKRLADLSSGLGVDFYRIVLAYGQVRSAAVLRGQELRQFTEAGIPMVDELAKKFTKLKGEVVSAGDVFGLISERQVPFEMVKEVIDDLTNEGGKFYMMQEKQAETLKGKVSNLADRYDIMMNSLGEANDGVLKGTVDALAAIMEHANLLVNAVTKLAAVWGAYKIATIAQTAAMGKNVAVMTAEEAKSRVKQANLLREAQLYRELTAAEKQSMYLRGAKGGMFGVATRTNLSSQELGQLAVNSRITQNEALRLAYIGKINQATMKHLVTQKIITQQQMQQVMLARQQAVSWLPKMLQGERAMTMAVTARLALMRGMSGLMAGLGAIFNPTTLAIAGISAAFTAIENYRQQQKQMEENAQHIADSTKENYDELCRYIAENPLEIKANSDIDTNMLAETLRHDIEEIQKTVPQPLANGLIASVKSEDGLEAQAQKAREILEAASLAQVVLQDVKKELEDAADDTDAWWFFGDSLKTNIEDFADDWQEFQSSLNGISRPQALEALQKSGLEKVSDDAKTLAMQLKDSSVSMMQIYGTAKKLYEGHNTFQSAIDFMKNSGFDNVYEAQNGGLFEEGYISQFETMSSQIDETVANLKTRLENKLKPMGIELGSDTGRIIVETLKKSWMKDNGITDGDAQQMFGFLFDKGMMGGTDAAFSMLGDELGKKLSDNAMQAVKKFKEDGQWSDEMTAACEEAKQKLIDKFPELKDELTAAWNVNPATFQIYIETALAVQKLEDWKKTMIDTLGDKYEIAIKMTTNVKEAQDAIQKVYDDARAFITKQKPLFIKLGIQTDTKSLQNWINQNQYIADPATLGLVKNALKSAQTIDAGQPGIDKGWISTNKSDKKDKPKSSGSQKDKYTDDLKRRYESFKKAISEYNKAIQSMGEAEAKALVKTVYGIKLPDKYIDKYGGIALAEDFEKKNTKKTDAAKNFRETLRNDKTDATVQKETDSYDALAEAQMEQIKITEKQYKAYDDLFKKTGDAKLSSIMAFGTETKPYKDFVEYMKAELVGMGEKLKTEGVSFDELLKLSPQDMEKLPKPIQELFKKIQEAIATDGEDVRKQLSDVFSKTDDEDVKIALNNNLRDNLLAQLPEQMKNASPEAVEKTRQVINDYYNKLNKELNLEKIKKSLNFEEMYGDLSEMSLISLNRLIRQLEKIVAANNDLDPQKLKEWVGYLKKLKQARAELDDSYIDYKAFRSAKKDLKQTDSELSRINELEYKGKKLGEAYDAAIDANDAKTQADIENMSVTVQLVDENGKLVKSTISYRELLDRQGKAQQNVNTTNPNQFQGSGKGKTQNGWQALTSSNWIGQIAGNVGGKGAGGGAGAIAIVDAIIQGVHKIISDLGDFVETVGGNGDSHFIKKLEKLDEYTYGGWEKLKQGNVLGAMSDTIKGWNALGNLFNHDTEMLYQEERERYKNLVEVWDTVCSRLEEVLDESTTEDITKNYERLKKIYEENITSAKELGKQYLNAGAGWFSHSHGVDQRKDMTSTAWSELNSWANNNNISSDLLNSIKEGRMTGLFDLSAEQLKTLQEEAPNFFAELQDDTREYLQTIIDAGDSLEDLEDTLKEMYTSTTADSIADSFASALDSMDDPTKTFANNFTKTLRNAVIQAFINSTAMQNKIQTLYDKMAEYASNSEYGAGNTIYSDREWSELQGLWDNISEDSIQFQTYLKKLGAYADQTSGSLSGSIKSITEETADLLASYVNAIRADVAFIRSYYAAHFNDDNSQMQDVVTTISVAVANIEANTRRSADNTDDIVDLINAVTKTTSTGKALRVV